MKEKMPSTARFDPETRTDKCPVCRSHPEDLGYKILSSGTVMMMCCDVCGVVYIPESVRSAMEEVRQKKEESHIISPEGMIPIGPKLKS